jgi:hypothetical protein
VALNVAVEWSTEAQRMYKKIIIIITLLRRIREIPGSNLGLGTDYTDKCFRGVCQSLQASAGILL